MKSKLLTAAILASSALAVGAFGSSASAHSLSPGSYLVDGIQDICIVSGGTWYGEDFAAWGGVVIGTNVFGNYAAGAGNDSMVVKHGNVNWTEWRDDLSLTTVLKGTFVKTSTTCTPPPTTRSTTHKNPMD
jgi:hypothetical protein